MTPLTLCLESTTGKLVKPDLYSLSRTRGPRISFLSTKTILDFATMSSPTVRVSKLIMAAMRLRSLVVRIDLGVRLRTSINSSSEVGVYLVGFAGVLGERYLSSLGSSHFTNFRNNDSNMI